MVLVGVTGDHANLESSPCVSYSLKGFMAVFLPPLEVLSIGRWAHTV